MGWIVLHRAGRDQPRIRIEDWPYELEQPIGPALAAEQAAVELDERLSDADVLALPWRLASDVVAETRGEPGAADPQHVVYRQQRGFRRAVELDTALAGVLGACDGELPLGRLIEAVAGLLDLDRQRADRRAAAERPPAGRRRNTAACRWFDSGTFRPAVGAAID